MAAGSSSHPSQMAFDVFLSFNRDEEDDGYRRFIKCLYETLSEWGIKMFMDDDKKMFMDDIKMLKDDGKKMFMDDEVNLSDDIVKAIEGSITSIVVLTKGYASSKWCLRELVKIIDQKNKTKHQVLPLFYRHLVHPYVYHQSQDVVRHQSQDVVQHQSQDVVRRQSHRKFFKSMAEKDYSEVNYRTSLAMSEFCRLPGIYISRKNSNTKFQIKSTAKQIIDRLLSLKLEAKEGNLFEMPLRLRTMEMLLGLGSNDIRFIGIVGMSGIGKTTLAEMMYAHSFKSLISGLRKRCFLHSRGRSIVSLQQQLLDQLASSKMIDIQILDENHGVRLIKQHLSSLIKVLIVFDGISETSQLEMLAGSPDWFGAGSRIIITTTNKYIFRHPNFKDKVQEYNVELLSHEAAFSLFCKLAFGDYPPSEDMKDLCNEIIEKVGRLPLALEKIASSLYGHDMDIWEDTLKNFHKVVYDNIFSDILKSSYEGLEAESQQIFLDLACFLNGEKVDRVIEILQGFGYSSPQTNLQLLVDRCLIDILDGHIQMHILILCMGKEIVRRKLGTCQQTRIWLRDDARRLFHENNELKYICGIVMDLEEEEELVLKAKAFAGMSELKILRINNVQLSEDIEFLSNKLTLLNWPGYPSKYLPSTFQPPSLIELHLPGSNVERLWNGTQKFKNLKEIDASDSKYLVETPNFSEARNLRRLILRNCGRLKEVHSSINSLHRLILFDMEGCVSFKSFSFVITCESLKTLVLSNCGLEFFPEFGFPMGYLTELHIDGTSINELSPSIKNLLGLVLLNLGNCIRLSSLPTEIGSLSSLKTLILNGCKNLHKLPPSLEYVKPLEELDIGGTSISTIPFVENLRILNCERLKSIIWHSLASLPTEYFSSLKDLNLSDCNLVDEDIPSDLELFSSLEILDLGSNHFERLSESIEQLINLKVLYLNDCHKLKQVPKLPQSIRYVGGEKSLGMLTTSQGSPACTMSPSSSNAPLLTNNDNFQKTKEVDIIKDMGKRTDHKLILSHKTSLVGMENQVEKVCNLLDLERSKDTLFVGIFGSSGIGKTTIAEVVYNTIVDQFQSGCFLYLSSEQNSLVPLQHQMLSHLLSKETKIWDEDHGAQMIKHHMSNRKVLIVLDGVDERNQIEKLVGSPTWFAPGSRVIITARNRDVLHQLDYRDQVQEYKVELLSCESAYSLFCKNAFGDGPSDKNDLCSEIVEKVGRLPLALRTIGSYLHNKELEVWIETLKRLDELEQNFFDTISQRTQKKTTPTLGQI
uniref:Resistance gene-like protein n=1 Tax=Cucumis melo TaxID=3656 RepID=M4QW86_CUCME|nr:resistance gene-like protein [Cucumis melo]